MDEEELLDLTPIEQLHEAYKELKETIREVVADPPPNPIVIKLTKTSGL
jgi:hypothetical protein